MAKIRLLQAALFVGAASFASSAVAQGCGYAPVEESVEAETPVETVSAAYVGMSVEAAEELAASEGRPFRIVTLDGEPQMVTRDYRPGRINASVENGVVVDASIEGASAS